MDSFLAKGPAAQPVGFETESEVSDAASDHALSRESMPDVQAAARPPQPPRQPSPPPSPEPPPPPPAPASTTVDLAVQDAPAGENETAPVQETRALFAPYAGFCPGPAHPADLFTSSTLLLAMKRPDVAFVHEELMLEDRLSSPQLDAVALSAARVQDGKALLVGCATGTGKGRMLCASAWNHALFHKTTCVLYLTVSSALAADVRRDVAAIGWNVDIVVMVLRLLDVRSSRS